MLSVERGRALKLVTQVRLCRLTSHFGTRREYHVATSVSSSQKSEVGGRTRRCAAKKLKCLDAELLKLDARLQLSGGKSCGC